MSEQKQLTVGEVPDNQNPNGQIYVNGVYNINAHALHLQRQAERDITIPQIVDDLGEDLCDFIEIVIGVGGVLMLTYHPNPKGIIPDDMKWISKPAKFIGSKGRLYKQSLNGRIQWFYKVLVGDFMKFMTETFMEDIINGLYTTDLKAFGKKVSKFILDYPHDAMSTYGCYFAAMSTLIKTIDEDIDPELTVSINMEIAKFLKYVAKFDDKNLPPFDLYMNISDIKTEILAVDCSSKVNYKLSLIDRNAQSSKTYLLKLNKEVEEKRERLRLEKEEKASKVINMINSRKNNGVLAINAQKRKIDVLSIEQIEDGQEGVNNEEPQTKKQRIDVVEVNIPEKDILTFPPSPTKDQ